MTQTRSHRIIVGLFAIALAYCCYALVLTLIASITNASIPNSETAAASNVVFEFVLNRQWHYPFHAQHLFYPGVEKFMIHPPLHYLHAALWFELFGPGIAPLYFATVLTAVVGVALCCILLGRICGREEALIALALFASFYGLYWSAQQLRPDLAFGFVYALLVWQFARLMLTPGPGAQLERRAALTGFLVIATLATHWMGLFMLAYLPAAALLLLARQARRSVRAVLFLAGGAATGLLLWWVFMGNDLWRSFLIVPLKGAELKQILEHPNERYFRFFLDEAGGRLVCFGLLANLVCLLRDGAVRVVRNQALAVSSRISIYLWLTLLYYAAVMLVFVGSRQHSYAANVYFLVMPLAAVGYGRVLRGLCPERLRPAGVGIFTAMFAVTVCANSPMLHEAERWQRQGYPYDPNFYADVRQALRACIPDKERVLVGPHAYIYLPDSNYVSSIQLMAEHAFDPPPLPGVNDLVNYYLDMPGKDYRERPYTHAQRKAALERHARTFVSNDQGGFWQSLFIDPLVWSDSYSEIATIYFEREQSYFKRITEAGNKFLTVHGSLAHTPAACGLDGKAGLTQVGVKAYRMRYGAERAFRQRQLDQQWLEIGEEGREQALANLFAAANWYGAKLDNRQQERLVHRIAAFSVGYTKSALKRNFNGVPRVRTVGHAINRYFANRGIAELSEHLVVDEATSSGRALRR